MRRDAFTADLAPETVLAGKYRIDRLLAAGGMSRIYLGNPLHGAGMVAIKQILLEGGADERKQDYDQFRREFELLSTLTHPSLPMALEFFEERGMHFLVEEFVPGETLESRLERDGRMEPKHAVSIAVALLDVLSYLHERKIIYRDLKPGNILITPVGAVRLIDFGAARRFRPEATRDTVPLGTPGFAPPEQYGRGQTTARSDIYSLGAVMHCMLTGRDPMEGEAWKFAPPHELFPEIPRYVSDAVCTAVSLDARDRFSSAKEMREALLPSRSTIASRSLLSPLIMLRHRYQYVELVDYFATEISWRGLGVTLATIAGFAAVEPWTLFPVQATAAGLAATGLLTFGAIGRFLRFRLLVVETFDEGIRVRSPGQWLEAIWADVAEVRVFRWPERIISVEIETAGGTATLDGAWPGTREVVDEVVRSLGMRSDSTLLPGCRGAYPIHEVYTR